MVKILRSQKECWMKGWSADCNCMRVFQCWNKPDPTFYLQSGVKPVWLLWKLWRNRYKMVSLQEGTKFQKLWNFPSSRLKFSTIAMRCWTTICAICCQSIALDNTNAMHSDAQCGLKCCRREIWYRLRFTRRALRQQAVRYSQDQSC